MRTGKFKDFGYNHLQNWKWLISRDSVESSEIQNSCCIMGALSEMVNALDALNFFSRGEGA
uniref:Uncharacterized protein n=1 Tax=Triticum urartu TaxID=4572 RepID=A0A8R7UKV8_TRIUA